MEKNSFYEAGEQIKNIVQNAVDSGNFNELSDTITKVVNDAVDGIQTTLKERAAHGEFEYSGADAAERIRKQIEERRRQMTAAASEYKKAKEDLHESDITAGNVMTVLGYSLAILFGIPTVISVLIGIAILEPFMILPAGICGGIMAAGISFIKKGKRKAALVKRFRQFKRVIGDRKFCKYQELADATGLQEKEIRKDVRDLLTMGWFKDCYIDREETMIITDQETYRQYQEARKSYENRMSQGGGTSGQAAQRTTGDHDYSKLPPQAQEIIKEGQKYIQHIHVCNEKIPGEEITGKLNRLEHTVTRIFDEVEKNPSAAGELKKLMNYYLPTTSKLLDAYCDLEEKNVSGKNIDTTKQEIEKALDTINLAFENLLDSLFQNQAWDISSDISVLNTMLAQEGLTESDFEKMKQTGQMQQGL